MPRRIRLTGWNRYRLEAGSRSDEGPLRQFLRYSNRDQLHLDCFWRTLSEASSRYSGVANFSSRRFPEEEEVGMALSYLSPEFNRALFERYSMQGYLRYSDIVEVNRRYNELNNDYRASLYCSGN